MFTIYRPPLFSSPLPPPSLQNARLKEQLLNPPAKAAVPADAFQRQTEEMDNDQLMKAEKRFATGEVRALQMMMLLPYLPPLSCVYACLLYACFLCVLYVYVCTPICV